ncbi:MAG: holo-ACP synthase [Mycetocola sp.]
MIVGIGVDVVDLARFERALTRTPKLRDRLFTPAERGLALRSLAGRFAAKEALIKALGGSDGVRWQEMEILNGPEGEPRFHTVGETGARVGQRGITRIHVTMSHDAGVATAFVVAEGDA